MNNTDKIFIYPELEQLTYNYNISLINLASSLKTKINNINKLSISKQSKLVAMNKVKHNYNASIKQITSEYNKKKDELIKMTNKKALLIGINYINTSNELYGCINDTNNIKDMLANKFKYNVFTILTDKTNKKPNKQNIIEELTNMLVNAKAGDNLFFLYSGHGTYTTDLNKDESDSQDELIVPLDAVSINTCIIDDELNKIIQTNLKKDVKLFMLVDCCFSGTIVDLKYNYVTNTDDTLIINDKVLDTLGEVFVISGCRDDQTSDDAYVTYLNKQTYSGAMTYSFLNAINSLGTNITLYDLIIYMRDFLKTNRYEQVPQLSSGRLVDIKITTISI